jgi:hypothetical protein
MQQSGGVAKPATSRFVDLWSRPVPIYRQNDSVPAAMRHNNMFQADQGRFLYLGQHPCSAVCSAKHELVTVQAMEDSHSVECECGRARARCRLDMDANAGNKWLSEALSTRFPHVTAHGPERTVSQRMGWLPSCVLHSRSGQVRAGKTES